MRNLGTEVDVIVNQIKLTYLGQVYAVGDDGRTAHALLTHRQRKENKLGVVLNRLLVTSPLLVHVSLRRKLPNLLTLLPCAHTRRHDD